jgi:hypothetical protein
MGQAFGCVLEGKPLAGLVRLVCLGVACGVTLARPAWGQPVQANSEEKPLATSLFLEGRALMAAGKIPEACRKLEESLRLDAGGGTLLNVALCHEKEGKTATAWAEYTESVSLARTQNRPDRLAFAQDHLTALQPTLSKLVIMVPANVDEPELTIKQDGRVVGRAAWGAQIPIDPGLHTLEWVAPKKKPSSVQVTIAKQNDLQTVSLTALEDAPLPPPSPAQIGFNGAGSPTYEPGSKPRQVLGLTIAGLGLAGIGVGAYFGLDAIAKKKDSDRACPNGICTQEGVNYSDKAGTSADVSTACFVIGGSAALAGAWLFFTGLPHGEAPPPSSGAVSPRLIPTVGFGKNAASLDLSGRF